MPWFLSANFWDFRLVCLLNLKTLIHSLIRSFGIFYIVIVDIFRLSSTGQRLTISFANRSLFAWGQSCAPRFQAQLRGTTWSMSISLLFWMTLPVKGLIQRPVTTRHSLSVANRTVVLEVSISASARLFWQSPSASSHPLPNADLA